MIGVSSLEEPELEFGGGMRHLDMRFGLTDFGPFDGQFDARPKQVRIGIVGSSETVDGTLTWLDRCQNGIEAKESKQPNLFPAFPGLGETGAFRCEFQTATEHQRILPERPLNKAILNDQPDTAQQEIVDLYVEEIRTLADANSRPDVILLPLPLLVIETVYNRPSSEAGDDTSVSQENFRGKLKAACMQFRIPIQILWPTTYDSTIKIARKLKKMSDRRVQDDATRAWNLMTAIYYKAGGLPWRLVRDNRELRTSFVGISFHESGDGEYLQTSTAQMFDERGEGLILRGGRANETEEDRNPHLSEQDAFSLLSESLDVFRSQHNHLPARVVLHKSSRFTDSEIAGFDAALDDRDIDYADYITISKTFTRLYRMGAYPPLRGTLVKLEPKQAVLYAKGSVDFFKTYPGMYVPRPLLIRCQRQGQPLSHIASEVLALTKMNWNNTQFDGGYPVTIGAARQVGDVLKYVKDGQEIAPRFSFYM